MPFTDMHGNIVLHGKEATQARDFLLAWGDRYLHLDIAGDLTCKEVEALAGMLLALGADQDDVNDLIKAHASENDEGDLHYYPKEQ